LQSQPSLTQIIPFQLKEKQQSMEHAPGVCQMFFVFISDVGGAPKYSCVSDTFVVTSLAVVPEP
jgi:hypothetical protein